MGKKEIAHAYYTAVGEKNVEEIEKHLHPDVILKSPLATIEGKEGFLEATSRYMSFFNSLTIRAHFGSENQAMIVYDVDCPKPIGIVPTAVLMNFKDNLISKIELFFDARPF